MSPENRIAYVLKRYPRYSETFVVNEVLALERAGLEVSIFSLRHPEDGHFQDAIARVRARVTYVPAVGLRAHDLWDALQAVAPGDPGIWTVLEDARGFDPRHLYQALRVARAVREAAIPRLHAHFASEATTVARLAARFAGVPYTFTAHAKDIFHQDVRRDELIEKMASARAVVTVSDFNRRYLRELCGPRRARIERVYNGLELERFPFAPPAERSPRILAVGRLVEKKGFIHLIDACERLGAHGVGVRCDIVGAGPLEAALARRIQALGLEQSVRLLGPLPQAEVVRRLRDAAVFAAPCVEGTDGNRDGLPTVLLEAMAVGTPCVSTPVTGIPEAIRDGESGLLVPSGDPVELARALERVLRSPTLRVSIARRARAVIEERFDIHRNARRLCAIHGIGLGSAAPAMELAS